MIMISMILSAGYLPPRAHKGCIYWVAPSPIGDDAHPGTSTKPWASLEHAVNSIPDLSCTVYVNNGTYKGRNRITRRFDSMTNFKAVEPYGPIFESDGMVVDINGAKNLRFEGFEFRHSGTGESPQVVKVDRAGDVWSENIIFYNNIFHDSNNDDLLKIHNGARFITVSNNLFYNQMDSEQHIDVNSVTDITISDNIFFNDFSGSGRNNPGNTKAFIVIKDSNQNDDGLIGARRVHVKRNIFLNWQGGSAESFIQVGNDGKPYFEAQDVQIENNLFLGNSADKVGSVFGVRGARDVIFNNNTIVGDMPCTSAYAFRIGVSGENPKNENIAFYNNIWSDPTGTMGSDLDETQCTFSDGKKENVNSLILENNVYWNDDEAIPDGLVDPLKQDNNALVGDPQIPTTYGPLILPRWDGNLFLSGMQSIRQEFLRLVGQYGQVGSSSIAARAADPEFTPKDDILGRKRDDSPEVGAFEIFQGGHCRDFSLPVFLLFECN